MPAITSENVARAIVKLVAAEFLPPLVGLLIMGRIANRSFANAIAQRGDTITVPVPPVLVANNIAETGTVTTQNPAIGGVDVVLDKHIEASFQIPDVVSVVEHPETLSAYMMPAQIALAEKIETDFFKAYPLLANVAGADGAAITEDVVDDAERMLFDAKLPQGLRRWLILASQPYSTLRQMARFSESGTIGTGLAIETGNLPTVKGFFPLRSQYVQKVGSVYHNLAVTDNTFVLAMRRLPQVLPGTGAIVEYAEYGGYLFRIVISYAPNSLAQQFTIDALYGINVVRHQFGVDVKCNG